MSDHDGRPPHGRSIQSLLHQTLTLVVKRRRRLVQKQDLGLPKKSTGNAESLTLAAGEVEALETELGVDAVVERLNEIPDTSLTAGVLDLGVRRDVLESEGEVETDLVELDVKGYGSEVINAEGLKTARDEQFRHRAWRPGRPWRCCPSGPRARWTERLDR